MLNSDSAETWFRRLGPWESFCQLTHEVAFGGTIVCAIVELFGPIDARILQESAEMEAEKHHLLRVRIAKRRGEWWFREATGPHVGFRVTSEPWQAAVEEALSTPFFEGPLARVCLVNDGPGHHWIVASFHHGVADALNAFAFVRGLFEDSPVGAHDAPIEIAHKKRTSLLGFAQRFIARQWHSRAAKRFAVPFESAPSMPERRTRSLFRSLDPAPLLATARAHQTTLHALLSAAQLVHFRRFFGVPDDAWLRAHTAVDLRQACTPPLPAHEMGCHIAVVDTAHAKDDDVFRLAHACKSALRQAIDEIGYLPEHLPHGLIKPLIGGGIAASERSRRYINHTTLTNLGVIDFPTTLGGLKRGDAYFSSGRRMGDFPTLIHAVTIDGVLRLCFSYEHPLLSDARAEAYADQFLEALAALAVPTSE